MRIIASPVVITIFMAISLPWPTYAADVTIYISGDIIASSCTLENNGIHSINLGQNIPSQKLSEASSYSDWKKFNVTLRDCPTGTSKVTAHFSGPIDSIDNKLYANISQPDNSRNVAIELQRVTGSVNAGNGQFLSVNVDSNNRATFDMQARLYSTTGGATAGNISSMVIMNFTYN
ncbi:type 1 fimbrial protein [Klebsiella sp. RHBSTW-00484]|uniref:fimbrial protein n=1 Tax=unclassified Klebsiella TaxID=2608929 RepID=UPI0015E4E673|nr:MULTISPECIES: fimbrial protein [unclassified Klebsiella]MBA7847450.1 type 1 fimbrial protein [Klebsiella sp. RHBSTW-00465]QLO36666.1 type 1 fimbrial protein [Klebsiella sp. RHBSTW-00484]QLT76185.1 type 1 fimbrial protein [Klebsiella sp. RHBSTW-00464]